MDILFFSPNTFFFNYWSFYLQEIHNDYSSHALSYSALLPSCSIALVYSGTEWHIVMGVYFNSTAFLQQLITAVKWPVLQLHKNSHELIWTVLYAQRDLSDLRKVPKSWENNKQTQWKLYQRSLALKLWRNVNHVMRCGGCVDRWEGVVMAAATVHTACCHWSYNATYKSSNSLNIPAQLFNLCQAPKRETQFDSREDPYNM